MLNFTTFKSENANIMMARINRFSLEIRRGQTLSTLLIRNCLVTHQVQAAEG